MTQAQTATLPEAGNVTYLFRRNRALRTLTARRPVQPSDAQSAWLARGLRMPDGVLPLFDRHGQRVDDRVIRTCLRKGWAEAWFRPPATANWLVCKLTDKGRAAIAHAGH